jgi:hypothetical protein
VPSARVRVCCRSEAEGIRCCRMPNVVCVSTAMRLLYCWTAVRQSCCTTELSLSLSCCCVLSCQDPRLTRFALRQHPKTLAKSINRRRTDSRTDLLSRPKEQQLDAVAGRRGQSISTASAVLYFVTAVGRVSLLAVSCWTSSSRRSAVLLDSCYRGSRDLTTRSLLGFTVARSGSLCR